jgi:quercetin dioxygenase-like cupin family protein
MFKTSINVAAVALVAVFSSSALVLLTPATAQQPTVTRKVLLKQDAAIPGYEVDLVAVEIPSGGREGRHTHPGLAMIYVQEGSLTLDYDGKPTVTYKPGDSFSVEPDKIHEGRNDGNTSVKALATFVIRKGMPLASPVR